MKNKATTLATFLAALFACGYSADTPQSAAPEKPPLQEWQTSWEKFQAHLLKEGADIIAMHEARARELGRWEPVPGTYGIVVTNGSLELMIALSNGPVAPSALTEKHQQLGFGAEVEFAATFKEAKATSEGEKKNHRSELKLEFEDAVSGPFCFSDPSESEMAKWKSVKAGSKIRWHASVSAVALWTAKQGTAVPIVTFTQCRIVD